MSFIGVSELKNVGTGRATRTVDDDGYHEELSLKSITISYQEIESMG
jgi:hypothetical protein